MDGIIGVLSTAERRQGDNAEGAKGAGTDEFSSGDHGIRGRI
jgi:hypothetical protein